MNNEAKLISTGYLYSPWNGKLREYTGEVHHRDKYYSTPGGYIIPEYTCFLVKDEGGRTIKKLECAFNEGELHNKVVWLKERDMSRAAGILIEYEEAQISKLRLQIENHECLIESLKGYLG